MITTLLHLFMKQHTVCRIKQQALSFFALFNESVKVFFNKCGTTRISIDILF